MKAWPPGKHNLHEGQEMEESRVRVPSHSAPTHLHYIQSTPSQDGSQQDRSYPCGVPKSKPSYTHPLGSSTGAGGQKSGWKAYFFRPLCQDWSPFEGKGQRKWKRG